MKKRTQKSENPFPYSDSNKRYHSFDYYLKQRFGGKCARLPLDAGLLCPNLDGTLSTGGCAFCSGRGSGDFCMDSALSIPRQMEALRERTEKKWPGALYIPYFQAHTNTYAPVEKLSSLYESALSGQRVVGLAIATRADCLPPDVLGLLENLSRRTFLTVELGLQTVHDATAARLNRGHSYADFCRGYAALKERGIPVCVHLINGLPGETKAMMLETAETVAALEPDFVKIHLLHVLRGTRLAQWYEAGEFSALNLEDYVDITVSQIERFPAKTVFERLTGDGKSEDLIAPLWSLKKFCVMNEIDKEFYRRNSFQGKKYEKRE